jgi:hypothetical protein
MCLPDDEEPEAKQRPTKAPRVVTEEASRDAKAAPEAKPRV